MLLFGNHWELLDELSTATQSAINEKGEAISTNSEIKHQERKFKPKKLEPIFQYCQFIGKILDNTSTIQYWHFPRAIVEELTTQQSEISTILTAIRSIQAVYKSGFYAKIGDQISKLERVVQSYIHQVMKFFAIPDVNNNLPEDVDHSNQANLHENQNKTVNNTDQLEISKIVELWYDIETIKGTEYRFELGTQAWLANFDEIGMMKEIFENYCMKSKGDKIPLSELFSEKNLTEFPFYSSHSLRLEILHWLNRLNILIPWTNYKKYEKQKKDQIKQQLSEYLQPMIKQQLIEHLSRNLVQSTRDSIELKQYQEILSKIETMSEEELNRQLPNIILQQFTEFQEALTEVYEGNLEKVVINFRSAREFLDEWFNPVLDWIQDKEELLDNWKAILRKSSTMLTQISGELIRQEEELEQYANSVAIESDRSELNNQIDLNITQLKQITTTYQTDLMNFMKDFSNDVEPLQTIMINYNEKIGKVQKAVKHLFSEYKSKGINFLTSMDFWQNNLDEEMAKVRFYARSIMENVIEEFNSTLKMENSLSRPDVGKNSAETIPVHLGLEFINPAKLSKHDLQDRIAELKAKEEEIKTTLKCYQDERRSYQQLLEDYLKTHEDTISKQCVICHKEVDVADHNFIKCEFCGSLSHYVCIANWINQYNSCPVCHNQYTIPNNQLFDPTKMEENSDLED